MTTRVTSAGAIVSLFPAATELVFALGAGDRLGGVTHECDHPEAARRLPRVTRGAIDALDAGAPPAEVDAAVAAAAAGGGALFALDEARIAAIAPALILTQALCDVCAVREDDVRALAARLSPVPRVVTLAASTFDDVVASIGVVAAAIGAEDEGEELAAGIRVRLRSVHDTLKAARAPRPRVAVLEWTDPPYVAGHWVPDMVRRAGGADALAEAGAHSVRTTAEQVRHGAPDLLVLAPCGYDVERARLEGRRLLDHPDWGWARSLPAWAMDGNALTSRPGPRLCDGVETMARIFHPSLFSPVDPRHARHL